MPAPTQREQEAAVIANARKMAGIAIDYVNAPAVTTAVDAVKIRLAAHQVELLAIIAERLEREPPAG